MSMSKPEVSTSTNPMAQYGGGGNFVPIENPMAHPHTLEMILDYLTVSDLKECRLVSKFWRQVATKPLQKKKGVPHLRFGDTYGRNDVNGVRDMLKLVECVDTGKCFPCAKFVVSTEMIRNSNRTKDEAVFVRFFRSISPFVLELLILCDAEEGVLQLEDKAQSYFKDLQFPRLKRMCVSIHTLNRRYTGFRDLAWKHRSVLELTTTAMKTSNCLEFVWFDSSPQCATEATPLLLDCLLEANNKKITNLTIPAPTDDNIWKNLLQLSCYLNALWVSFVTEEKNFAGLTPFLEGHSTTLNTLSITSDSTVPGDCVPNLPKLHYLYIQAKKGCANEAQADFIFPMIPMTHRFTNLRSVSFLTHAPWDPSPWDFFVDFGDEVVVATVRKLTLPSLVDDPEVVEKAARVFPNIEHIGIPARAVLLEAVVEAFPGLAVLTLDTTFASKNGIDHVLTGMTHEKCQDAFRKMKNWTPKFNDIIFAPGLASLPLLCLSSLYELRLYTSFPDRKLEFTKVSIILIFIKMKRLKYIDLGNRKSKYPPDAEIPKRVLKELTKSCEISWNFVD